MAGPDFKKIIITFVTQKPVQAYLGGGAILGLHRYYDTRTTYNYWFGRFEYERRINRNQI